MKMKMMSIPNPMHGDISSSADMQSSESAIVELNRLAHRRKIVFACRAALTGSIGGLLLGFDLGVISGALPMLTEEFHLSIYQQELVTSLMLVGCAVGACFGGIICDRVGRKRTVYVVCFLFFIGSVIMALSDRVAVIYLGRIVIGFGVSVSAIVDISYLTEISPPEYRGAVVGTNELMITVGVLLAFLIDFIFMGVTQGWRLMFAFPILLVILWGTLMSRMPESPRWLLVKGRSDEAMAVFRITCGGSESDAVREFQRADESIQASRLAESSTLISIVCKEWRLSMIVSISLMLLQQFSGHSPVLTYSPELFAQTG
jgi:MFS family permease